MFLDPRCARSVRDNYPEAIQTGQAGSSTAQGHQPNPSSRLFPLGVGISLHVRSSADLEHHRSGRAVRSRTERSANAIYNGSRVPFGNMQRWNHPHGGRALFPSRRLSPLARLQHCRPGHNLSPANPGCTEMTPGQFAPPREQEILPMPRRRPLAKPDVGRPAFRPNEVVSFPHPLRINSLVIVLCSKT